MYLRQYSMSWLGTYQKWKINDVYDITRSLWWAVSALGHMRCNSSLSWIRSRGRNITWSTDSRSRCSTLPSSRPSATSLLSSTRGQSLRRKHISLGFPELLLLKRRPGLRLCHRSIRCDVLPKILFRISPTDWRENLVFKSRKSLSTKPFNFSDWL